MPISESQLDTWSHQGSIAQSSTTYNSIKAVLEAASTPYYGKEIKVFLQGSYGNDTNIYSESDVDIVIRLDDCFHSDLSGLSESEGDAQRAAYSKATYKFADFKRDVLSVLVAQYGSSVKVGAKAISIDANGSRRKADVIPAIEFRRYSRFRSSSDSTYTKGICFYNSAGGERIANYPKQHSANLTRKHQDTAEWLKPTIRVLKNLRSKLVDEGFITAKSAPSYYLEGLLYNLPNERFGSSYQNCVLNTLNWYQAEASKAKLVCANEQYYLLRDGSHTCWNQADCDAFINAAIMYWNRK